MMQIVFQNPYLSFDPRFNVLNAVGEPSHLHTSRAVMNWCAG